MPTDVFYWLLNMSITASIVGAIVLLLRAIPKLPRRVTVYLWAIPFLRMTLPVAVNGKYGLMTLLARFATKTVTLYEQDGAAISVTNFIRAADSYFPIVYQVDRLHDVFAVSLVIWAAVAGLLLLAVALLYGKAMASVRHAKRRQDNLYVSDTVTSPAVFGIVRPKIVIPSSLETDEKLRYILLHEQAHIRRRDNLWRMLALIITVLHWFNPLAWLFFKCFLSDLETACDERVLSSLSPAEHKAYALALINSVEVTSPVTSAFGGAGLRARVNRILSFKKITAASALAFAGMVAVIAYMLLTNAA